MKAIRRALLRWYRANARDFPWRRSRDPYAIWVSETMLQQTRSATVVPYYERFLKNFPTARVLACASPDEVMRHFAGLGYYSRARNLHAAAQTVVREHGGALPDEVKELRKLPGVGPYTAAALASIAFDQPVASVDGNVMRVLTRLLDLRDDIRLPATRRKLEAAAAELVRGAQPGALNQALMELGATLCSRRRPACTRCPLHRHCKALSRGVQATLPVRSPAPRKKRLRAAAALLLRGGRLLMVRRPPRGLLGGLWELPGGELDAREQAAAGLLRTLREGVGIAAAAPEPLGSVRHIFTHRVLRLYLFRVTPQPGRVRRHGFDAHRWCSLTAARALPLSSLARRALDHATASQS